MTRGQLLFEDAVKAADGKKGKTSDEELAHKFEAVLQADSNFAEADYNLGVIAERRGRRDEAVSHYQAALHKKPSLRQAAENLAVLQQNSGDLPGAASSYNEILRHHPDDGSSRARLAELYRLTGDTDKAVEMAKSALVRDPRSEIAYRVLLRAYVDKKQLALAKLVALRGLKLNDSDPEILYGLGLVFLEEKQPEKAWTQLEKAVAARGDYLPARMTLAKLALQNENYSAAETHLRAYLQQEPKSAEAHLDLGVALKGLGQYDKAMQEYDAAEKLNPDLAAVYLNRGIILHRHKDAPERGLELYKKYLALSGGDVALPVEAPVFGLMKEAEGLTLAKQQAAQAAEEEKKLQEAQKLQEKRLKEAEEDDKKKSGNPANGNGPPPNGNPPPATVVPASGEPGAQPVTTKGKVAPAPAPKAKADPAPKGATAPTDEPSDGL
jgi:tetratricopeptide (TPR) repeat protein